MLTMLALIISGPANSVFAGPNAGEGEIYLPVIMKNFDPDAVPGSLTGRVADANSVDELGEVSYIPEAEVCVGGYCKITNSEGYFEFLNITSGWQDLQASAIGWITIDESVYVRPNDTREIFIAMAGDGQDANDIQIVLTWIKPWEQPPYGDLDSHFWITNTLWTTPTHHIDIGDEDLHGDCLNPPYSCFFPDGAGDVEEGYGPESIYVEQVNDDYKATYAVLDAHPLSGQNITQMEAIVRIFKGNFHIQTFYVPTSGSGDMWYVFDITKSTGLDPQIVPVNCITYYPVTGEPPFCPPPED
jgi:hypothetical protein